MRKTTDTRVTRILARYREVVAKATEEAVLELAQLGEPHPGALLLGQPGRPAKVPTRRN